MKIESIEVLPLTLPFRGEFKTSRGTVGSSDHGRTLILVKITADDGSVGWGESGSSPVWSYETPETVYTTLNKYLAPALIGHDPFDIDGAHRKMNRVIAPGTSVGQPIAKAGIDLALHDLICRRLDIPLHKYWGVQREMKVTLSWTVTGGSEDEVVKSVAEGTARGYHHFNVKVGSNRSWDLRLCQLVKGLNPEGFLWADANGGYSIADALFVAPRFEEIGVHVLEQPLPHNQWHAWQELRRHTKLPVAIDETICSPHDLVEWIRAGAIDALTVKCTRSGGLRPARQCIEIAQAAGLMLLGSGLTDGALAFAAGVNLYAAYGITLPCALNGPQFLEDDYASVSVSVEGEIAHVPRTGGLGVEVDEAKVAHYRVVL